MQSTARTVQVELRSAGISLSHMSTNKIEERVQDCLNHCSGSDRPYMRLAHYVEALKLDGDWSASEIIELRVVQALLDREKGKQN
jgi:hypothetical protein